MLKEEKESMQVRVATGGKTKIRDSDREGKRENEFECESELIRSFVYFYFEQSPKLLTCHSCCT